MISTVLRLHNHMLSLKNDVKGYLK